MNYKIRFFLAFLFLSLLLVGCGRFTSSHYDVEHPEELLAFVNQCQINPPATQIEAEKCKTAYYAAKEMVEIIREIQSDPQQFGEHLLRNQTYYATQKQKLAELSKEMKLLKEKQASEHDLQNLQAQIDEAKAEAQQTATKIANSLAILGLSSPE